MPNPTLKPWTQADKNQWLSEQKAQRSYRDEVVSKITELRPIFDVTQYGAPLTHLEKYPLFLIRSKTPNPKLKTVLITGGVHGYETSGVHGALAFMKYEAPQFEDSFNFICAPCISPWAYETINRWNHKTIDPNRFFIPGSPAEECALFLKAASTDLGLLTAHFDLHETTDTDESVFRPALQARDGKLQEPSPIPDGFYAVGDSENPCPEFQKAIIDSVRKVTHIAEADRDGKIIGEDLQQEGVINYPLKALGLCAGISNAKYTTTTEVYPDSPRATPAICIDAQVAAIRGGLQFLMRRHR